MSFDPEDSGSSCFSLESDNDNDDEEQGCGAIDYQKLRVVAEDQFFDEALVFNCNGITMLENAWPAILYYGDMKHQQTLCDRRMYLYLRSAKRAQKVLKCDPLVKRLFFLLVQIGTDVIRGAVSPRKVRPDDQLRWREELDALLHERNFAHHEVGLTLLVARVALCSTLHRGNWRKLYDALLTELQERYPKSHSPRIEDEVLVLERAHGDI